MRETSRCPVCSEKALRSKIVRTYEYRTPMGIVTIEGNSKFEECENCGEILIPGKFIDEWNLLICKLLI